MQKAFACLHEQKDHFYSEDKHACGDDWGVVWAVLSSMALSVAKLMRKEEKTLKENKRRIGNKIGIKKYLLADRGGK